MPVISKVPASEIQKLLDQGLSVREIKERLGVGSDRVRKVRDMRTLLAASAKLDQIEGQNSIEPGTQYEPEPEPVREPEYLEVHEEATLPDIRVIISDDDKKMLFALSKNKHLGGRERAMCRRLSQ